MWEGQKSIRIRTTVCCSCSLADISLLPTIFLCFIFAVKDSSALCHAFLPLPLYSISLHLHLTNIEIATVIQNAYSSLQNGLCLKNEILLIFRLLQNFEHEKKGFRCSEVFLELRLRFWYLLCIFLGFTSTFHFPCRISMLRVRLRVSTHILHSCEFFFLIGGSHNRLTNTYLSNFLTF